MGNANGKAERGRESLWTLGDSVPYHAAITNLSTIRGRYVPVWAMAGTGTPANLTGLFPRTLHTIYCRIK